MHALQSAENEEAILFINAL